MVEPVGVVSVPTPGGQMSFEDDDDVIAPVVRRTGFWEPEVTELLLRLIRLRPGTYVDLGAHVGYHAVQLLGRAEECVFDAICVEPNQKVVPLLQDNLQPWWQKRVVVEFAAWSHEQELHLRQLTPRNGGDWRVLPADRHATGDGCDVVQGTSLDRMLTFDGKMEDSEAALERGDIPERVSVIKSDLQGMDHVALKGGSGVLTSERPDVVCEFDPEMIRAARRNGVCRWARSPAAVVRWYQEMHYGVRQLDGTVMSDPKAIVEWAEKQDGRASLWLQPIERLRRGGQ